VKSSQIANRDGRSTIISNGGGAALGALPRRA
jgi:hypothetical protein